MEDADGREQSDGQAPQIRAIVVEPESKDPLESELHLPAVNFPGLGLRIIAIEWERVWTTLTLEFDSPPPGEVDFVIYDVLRAFPVTATSIDERVYQVRINVTNFRDRHQVPNGSWRFMAVIDGRRGPIASYPLERADELPSSGRSYLYNQNRSTYVITFGLSQDDRADVIMRTYQLNRPMPKNTGGRSRKGM